MDYKQILWVITLLLTVIAYIPYIRDMIEGKTKPHIFTRFVRAIGAEIMFISQWTSGAWAWSWPNALVGLLCLFVAGYGFMYGSKIYIKDIDRFLLVLALWALILHFITDDRLWSVIFINISDFTAFIPSIRKAWNAPYTETASLFAINALKFVLMLLATTSYSFITISNSVLRLMMNIVFVVFLLMRRNYIK
jgi:hypothetical protein